MEKITKLIQPLFLVALTLWLLMLLKGFLIPFAYGLLLAIIVYPVCKKFEKRLSRSLSIFLSLTIVAVIAGLIVFVFILQFRVLAKELPALIVRIEEFFPSARQWLSATFGLSMNNQDNLIIDFKKNISANIGGFISGTFSFAAEALFNLVIIPLYAVLFLFYRRTLVDFLGSLIGEKYQKNLVAVLSETIHMYFNYIKGMTGVYICVGILNSIGLLILGVDYAIVFGMVTAFMTIIPYIGIIVSSLLPIAMVWAETNNVFYPLGVIAVFAVVQYLEANLIFPYIVGKQIGINMFVSIVAIILGGVLWGVSGMILFLPFAAILKIISGYIDGLSSVHKLLSIPG